MAARASKMGLIVSKDLSEEGVRRYLPDARIAFSAIGGCCGRGISIEILDQRVAICLHCLLYQRR